MMMSLHIMCKHLHDKLERLLVWIYTLKTKERIKVRWEGRADGWRGCENMVIERIAQKYPEMKEQLLRDLLQ